MIDVVDRQVELARRSGARDRTAIFMHIGKTAGTTLNSVLERTFPHQAVFSIDSEDDASAEAQLARLSETELRSLRLIRGHLTYGLHKVLPQPAFYFSLLRDPCQRLISLYSHVHRVSDHRLHRKVVDEGIGFQEFVTSGITLETDNWQLRCLAGDTLTPFGKCREEMLATALENIRNDFALVGVSEMFDDSLLILCRMYGWRGVSYLRMNEGTPNRPVMTPSDRAAIEPHIALEQALYVQTIEALKSLVAMTPMLRIGRPALRYRNAGRRRLLAAKRVFGLVTDTAT